MPNWLYALLLRNRDLRPAARRRAGIWRRALAALIDVVLAMLPAIFITIALGVPQQAAPLWIMGISAIIWPLLNILTTWRWGRTPGKWMLGLRVCVFDPQDPDAQLQLGQILLREGLFKAAIPLSFVAWNMAWAATVMWVGFLLALRLRIDRRALHDLPAHVQVVRTRGRAAREFVPEKVPTPRPSLSPAKPRPLPRKR
jgi:uncharacterized RDD family membrane protein YckC